MPLTISRPTTPDVLEGWEPHGSAPATFADHLRGRQILAAEQNANRALIGAVASASFTILMFQPLMGRLGWCWYIAVVIFSAARVMVSRSMRKGGEGQPVNQAAARYVVYSCILSGALLTAFPTWLVFHSEGFTFAFMLSIVLGTFWSGGFIHSPYVPSAMAYMLAQYTTCVLSALAAGLNWERGSLLILFTLGTAAAIHIILEQSALFRRSVVQQLELENKSEVIGLLLREHENQSSDWLWQADHRLQIHSPSSRFAEVFGGTEQSLEGRSLDELLSSAQTRGNGEALGELNFYLSEGRSFRDLVVPTQLSDKPCWFSISGRPVIDPVTGRFYGYRGVMTDVTAAKSAEAHIAYLADHDGLTGLPNRRNCLTALQRGLAAGRPFATLSIDLDDFKPVNDRYGHPFGDRVLLEIARRLQSIISSQDSVARFGDDEFVMQVFCSDRAAVEALCHRVLHALSVPIQIDDVQLYLGGSIGVAVAPDDGDSHETLLKNADAALYRAKRDGRGTFRFFSAEIDAEIQLRQAMLQNLRMALPRGELMLHYQPFLSLNTGAVTGCEALVRWNHPEGGLISPVDFIPLAEQSGLIVPIGNWVLEQACREAATWRKGHRVAVNISPIQLRDRNLVTQISKALQDSGLPPSSLEIEVTETVFVEEPEVTLDILQRIRALGVRVALDDFGTGYASLSYLRQFPFDKIKIDRSFILDLDTRKDSQLIVRAIRDIASGLGMTITAEGVENEGQVRELRLLGCHEMQGFLFSRPQTASALTEVMQRRFAA